jgi:hypothetical protein
MNDGKLTFAVEALPKRDDCDKKSSKTEARRRTNKDKRGMSTYL